MFTLTVADDRSAASSSRAASTLAAVWYSSSANGDNGVPGGERVGGDPAIERRPELRAEAIDVEVLQLSVVVRRRVDPLDEQSHIDLGLFRGEIGGAGCVDA